MIRHDVEQRHNKWEHCITGTVRTMSICFAGHRHNDKLSLLILEVASRPFLVQDAKIVDTLVITSIGILLKVSQVRLKRQDVTNVARGHSVRRTVNVGSG